MATLGLLSLAVFLQVLAGLIPILYEDLNPMKQTPEGAERVLNAPRSMPLVLLVASNSSEEPDFATGLAEALAKTDGANTEVITPFLLSDLKYLDSRQQGHLGMGPGMFHKWYTREARVVRISDVHDLRFDRRGQMVDQDFEVVRGLDALPHREVTIYCSLRRPFGRHDWELFAYRKAGQRLSLLVVGVAGLIRFASGEPILNLF
jgi:hypothetical protein